METGAIFSEDKKNRFYLWRTWDEAKPKVMIVGLNPSKANETKNDNTIDSAIGIMRFNGYGGLFMTNLFAYISTEPRNLNYLGLDSPIMQNNIRTIGEIKNEFHPDIVFAWGNFPQAKTDVAEEMVRIYGHLALCYLQLKDGSPRHLLYCKHAHRLVKFNPSKWLVKIK